MKPESIARRTAKGESGTPNPIPSETGKQSRSVNRMQVDSGANHGESVAKVGVNRDDLSSEPENQVRSEPAGHRRASLCFEGGSNVLGASVQDGAAKLEPRGLVCRMVVLFCEGSGGMSGVKPVVGEWYVQRDGSIVGPVTKSGGGTYPFSVNGHEMTAQGYFWGESRPDDRDLVEHIPRTDERHPEWTGESTVDDAKTECSEETEYVEVLMRMPKLPHGKRYSGEVRIPEYGEQYLNLDGGVSDMPESGGTRSFPIVVEDWQPPAWMPRNYWYSIDEDGSEMLTDKKPFFENGDWELASGNGHLIPTEHYRFERPTVRGKNAIWEVK